MQIRSQMPPIVLVLLALLLCAGCTGIADASFNLKRAPAWLPFADGAPRAATKGPPMGRPSLGLKSSGVPERLVLPSIGVETDVIEIGWQTVEGADGAKVSTWEVADFAAGWHKNSAKLGEGGNVVLSGHNNIRGAIFRKLYTMEAGDMAYIWANGQRYAYQVDEVMILEEKYASLEQRRQNAQWIQPFSDDRLTLVSCWPEADNTHRVIVVAHRVEE